MRDRRILVVAALVAASFVCVAIVEERTRLAGSHYYGFLVWNLVLAWVPFALALVAYDRARRVGVDAVVGGLAALWLLFLPNAPYILTDFVHLRHGAKVPVWFDALMLSSFAWTALLLGLLSLYLMQAVARRVVSEAWTWVGVAGALTLASVGVYLGRYVRFNSWDAVTRPGRVAHVLGASVLRAPEHPRMAVALVALTSFMFVGYIMLYGFAGLRLELDRDRDR